MAVKAFVEASVMVKVDKLSFYLIQRSDMILQEKEQHQKVRSKEFILTHYMEDY